MPPIETAVRRADSSAGVNPGSNLTLLCTEARRLAYRRCRAEAAARRLGSRHSPRRAARLAACSDRLLIAFHRTLDRIWAADGFDEALDVFRDYRAEMGRRLSRAAGPAHVGQPPAGPHLTVPPQPR